MNFPVNAADFTVDWLNTALASGGKLGDYKVIRVVASDLDIPGQTAEVARLAVSYNDSACPLPRQLIAKYTSRNPDVIAAVVNVYQQYWRETSFYREFADVGLSVPTCYYAAHDPNTQELVLLMNDLAPAESPSWAATPEQVAVAVSHLPSMHAKWWNSPTLREKPWLVQFDNRDFYLAAASASAAAVPRLSELFGADAAHTVGLMSLWQEKIDAVLDYISHRPFTLVHGDYHSKQMFFPTAAGGSFAVIDWQFSFVAQGAWDLIRITTLGQDAASRQAGEAELIGSYHESLKSLGVTDYSLAMLHDDIRVGLIVNQMIMSIALVDTDIALVEAECRDLGVDWRDVLILRGEQAVRDWDVLAFLDAL